LRGGAFNNNQRNVRCAYRNNRNPHNRNDNNGFRVVVAAHFSLRALRPAGNVARLLAWRPRHNREKARPVPGRALGRSAGNVSRGSPGPGEYGPGSLLTTSGDAPWVRPWRIPGVAYWTDTQKVDMREAEANDKLVHLGVNSSVVTAPRGSPDPRLNRRFYRFRSSFSSRRAGIWRSLASVGVQRVPANH
jgi:hypothetical protein